MRLGLSLAVMGSGAARGPSNTSAPSIAGTASEGQQLTAIVGSWSGSPTSYTYQWKRDGVNISSATASTYVLTPGDVGTAISVVVTAINSGGSTSAASAATSAVTAFAFSAIYAYGAADLDFSDATKIFTTNAASVNVANDADLVGYVQDKSGGAYHYSVADANRPTFKTNIRNGKSIVRFDGVNDYLDGVKKGLSRNTGKLHIIAAVNGSGTAVGAIGHFSISTGTGARAIILRAASTSLPQALARRLDADSSTTANGFTAIKTNWQIVHAFFDFTQGYESIYINGVMEVVNSLPSTGSTSDTDEQVVRIGTSTAAAQWFNGDMGRYIACRGASDAELRGAYARLASDFNIAYQIPTLFDPNGLGTWTWYNDPRVLALSPSRFVIGGVSQTGDIVVKDSYTGTSSILSADLERDDHDNPGFVRRASDGKILAFFSKHNDPNYYMCVSTNADDGSAWGAPVNLDSQLGQSNYAYANPFQLASGRIIVFFRATNVSTADWAWHYSYSDDGGTTWASAIQISGDARPYHKFRQNGGSRIDILVNDGHPDITPTNSTFHYYLEEVAGVITFHKTDGTTITSPPFDSTDWTQVYDGTTNRSWVHNITAYNSSPVAAYAVFPGATNTVATDHRYRQARYAGGAWTDEEVCAAGASLYAGQPFYSGGVITDPTNQDVVYCSRQVDAAGVISTTGTHQIFKAVRVSSGNWTLTQLTFSPTPCFRPYIPEGCRRLFYCQGPYASYTVFQARIESMDIA
jgi:BNR repeat-containing family member